jgi:predicted nucleic acid-binding protein
LQNEQNEPNIVNVQLEEENCVTVEEKINKTEQAIEQEIEPYLKKKRGKKK